MLSYLIESRNFFIEKMKNVFVVDYIPFLSSILSIFIGVWLTLPEHVDKAAVVSALNGSAIFSIFLFIVTDRFISSFSRTRDLAEIYNRFSILEQMIANGDQVICIGSHNNAISRISFSISQATTVWNTYFFYEVIPVFNYSKKNRENIINSMQEFLKRDGSKWIDVISDTDNHFLDRVNKALSNDAEENCYKCFKLINNSPYINFIVLEFDDQRNSEVFFGFGKHPNDEIGNVFYSTNDKIVTLFRRLHRTLRSPEISNPISFKNENKKINSGITGIWKSIAFKDKNFKDFALVSINQIGRITNFNGFIFNVEGKMEGWFEAEDVVISKKKMIFLYYKVNSKQVASDIKAIGIYDFGDKNNFIGKLIDFDENNSVIIRGKRATKEEEEIFNDKDRNPKSVKENIDKFLEELTSDSIS